MRGNSACIVPSPMFLAYYVHDLSPFLIQFGENFGLRWYGLAYVAAFAAGYMVYRSLARNGYSDLRPEQVGDFITWCAIFGVIVGGRLGYMLFYNFDGFLANPLGILRVWDGGMSSHGGILGITFFSLWYARKHQISWRNLGDNLVVVAPIGIGFGRLANFINGELYGRAANVPWAVQFPKELHSLSPEKQAAAIEAVRAANPAWANFSALMDGWSRPAEVQAALAGVLTPRHPSQLYSAALEGLLLFAVLWILRTKFRLRDGVLTGWFFIGYAVVRIAGEFFREPDAALTGMLTRGQFLSIFLIAIGVGFLISARMAPSFAPKWRNR